MKICNSCGNPNPDDAKFCRTCGHPLESSTTPQQPYVPEIQPQKNNKGLKIALIICGAVIALLIIVVCIMFFTKEGKQTDSPLDNIQTVEYDSSIVNGTIGSDVDTTTVAAPAVQEVAKPEPAPAAEPAPSKVTARGEIEGYPYSITGKWNGNKFSGTYKNEYNGVKMSCSGREEGGTLTLTLRSGKTTCSFELYSQGGGYYRGYFYPDGKSASLQF